MRQGAPELPIGIVFRRLHTDADRAVLADDLLKPGLDCTWSGSWDLAGQGSGLLARGRDPRNRDSGGGAVRLGRAAILRGW